MKTDIFSDDSGATAETDADTPNIDVGVIGVSSPRSVTGARDGDRAVWTPMEDYAALLRERTPLRAGCLPLAPADPNAVAARIARLPSRVSAVFLVGMKPTDSASVQLRVAGLKGAVVVSEADVLAAALGAAALGTLRCRGVAPGSGRIVVTDSAVLPRLAPLLIASGIATMTTWRECDAQSYPLRRVMANNDLLIDLTGRAADTDAPGRTLRWPPVPFDYGALVLPGLLNVLRPRGDASVTVEVLAACARALAHLAPPGQILPALADPMLVSAVAAEVARALSEPVPQRRSRPCGPAPLPATPSPRLEGQPS